MKVFFILVHTRVHTQKIKKGGSGFDEVFAKLRGTVI
jgi:hypothetical protein